MKRDLDRIRQILIECENDSEHTFKEYDERFDDFDRYQIKLMISGGLLTRREDPIRPPWADAQGLARYSHNLFIVSWAGHEYLDATRDQGIWNKTKQAVAETGGNATLEIIKSLSIGFLKKKISEQTGIAL